LFGKLRDILIRFAPLAGGDVCEIGRGRIAEITVRHLQSGAVTLIKHP
jgi:hypothetical protein